MYPFKLVLLFSLGKYPVVGLLDRMVFLFLIFWGTSIKNPVSHSGCTNLPSHPSHRRFCFFFSSTSSPTLAISYLFDSNHSRCQCIIFSLSIHLSMTLWVASNSWLLWVGLFWTWLRKYLFGPLLSIFLNVYPEVGLRCHMVVSLKNFKEGVLQAKTPFRQA